MFTMKSLGYMGTDTPPLVIPRVSPIPPNYQATAHLPQYLFYTGPGVPQGSPPHLTAAMVAQLAAIDPTMSGQGLDPLEVAMWQYYRAMQGSSGPGGILGAAKALIPGGGSGGSWLDSMVSMFGGALGTKPTAAAPKPVAASGGDNTMLYVIGALAIGGLLLLGGKKGGFKRRKNGTRRRANGRKKGRYLPKRGKGGRFKKGCARRTARRGKGGRFKKGKPGRCYYSRRKAR